MRQRKLEQLVHGARARRLDAEAHAGAGEPLEVLREPEHASAVDPHGLEGAAAAHERLVVDVHDGLARVDEPSPGDRDSENHTVTGSASGAPIAASNGRALTHDSSTSSSGSESQTMPPPTQRWMRPSTTANVRMVNARSKSPFG
jgi:hypothetical protein